MIIKAEPKYTEKLYCNKCNHAYEFRSYECQICGHPLSAVFLVDERHTALQQFRAARSMREYNIKMGNI